ncbi:DUF6768 family protein [Ahniella affigens]
MTSPCPLSQTPLNRFAPSMETNRLLREIKRVELQIAMLRSDSNGTR